jgi:DNA-binding transcriptional LysR family regulator
MGFKLPPLSSVRVFGAAARHGSFKKARGAQHHRQRGERHAVQNLEDWLGVALFQRGGGKLRLTSRRRLCGRGRRSVEGGRQATARLPGGARRAACDQLRTGVCRPLAAAAIVAIHRGATRKPVDIETSLKAVDLPMEGIDAAIRFAPASRAMPSWTRLLEESLVPVCSPSLLEKHAGLSGLELIARSASGDWAEWFRIVGARPPANVRAGLRVDTINMALEAARRGYGIALGRTALVDAEIKSGRLAVCSMVPSGWCYWLVTMDADFQSQDVKTFGQWLLDELGGAAQPSSKQKPRRKIA